MEEYMSKDAEIIGYNYFQTLWTKNTSDDLKNLNIKERVFGEFLVGPGQ